jgi:hypothetical protein
VPQINLIEGQLIQEGSTFYFKSEELSIDVSEILKGKNFQSVEL